jgi:hypothetical protein
MQSFAVPATPTQAYFSAVAYAIDGLTLTNAILKDKEHPRTKVHWRNNPYLFREARRVVEHSMELVQKLVVPNGELPVGEDPALINGPFATPNGRFAFGVWWDEIRRHNPKAPIDNRRPSRAKHQRLLSMLRKGANPLADEIKLGGLTGKQAQRQQKQTLSSIDFNRLRRLERERIRIGLSEQQLKQFQELFAKAPPEVQEKFKQLDPPGFLPELADLTNPGPFGMILDPIHTSKYDEDNRTLDMGDGTVSKPQ